MLWIENPVGVGFSYSKTNNYATGDAITAAENVLALKDFYSTFSALKSVDLYLAGESYAGVYIPMLAQAILKAQDEGEWAGLPLLKGIAVGNGCTGNDIGACSGACEGLKYHMEFLDSLAYIAPPIKATIETKCEWSKCNKNALNDTNNGITEECIDAIDSALGMLAAVNIYNVYATCTVNDGCGNGANSSSSSLDSRGEQATLGQFTPMNAVESFRRLQQQQASSRRQLNSGRIDLGIDDDSIPAWAQSEAADQAGPTGCIDSTAASKYMMTPAVQAALHIKQPAPSGCWSFCSTAPSWTYSRTMGDEPTYVYPDLWGRIDVLIYNGDVDDCVPWTDNFGWTSGLGFESSKPWHPWFYHSYSVLDASFAMQLGGYMVKYSLPKLPTGKRSNLVVRDATFHFATVRGSGHMVPQDQPNKIFELFSRYISLPTELSTPTTNAPTAPAPIGNPPPQTLHGSGSVRQAVPSTGAVVAIVVLSVALFAAGGWIFKLSRQSLPQSPSSSNDVVASPLQQSLPPRDDIPAVHAKRLGPASQGEASL